MAIGSLVLLLGAGPLAASLRNPAGQHRVAGKRGVTELVEYRRAGGLNAGDRRSIAGDARREALSLPLLGSPVVPFRPASPRGLVSPGGEVAYALVTLPDDRARLPAWVAELRRIAATGRRGLSVHVTRALGSATTAQSAFRPIHTMLLIVGALLMLLVRVRAASSDAARAGRRALEEWRNAARRVARAYRAWQAAERRDRPSAYSAYLTALEREEWAARRVERFARRAARGMPVSRR